MLTSYLNIKSATRLLLAATLLTTASFGQGPPPDPQGPDQATQGPNDQIPPPDQSDQSNQPGRGVARLSLLQGDVTLKRGDSGEWIAAAPNAPLVVQDRVISGNASKAEVQLDYANFIRLAQNTEIRFAELEYGRYVLQVASGTVTFRVLRNSDADVEVSTPTVAVRPNKRGIYRIAVQPDGTTEITIRNGEAEIYTTNGSEKLKSGRTMLVRGNTTDPEFQLIGAIPRDDWDIWNEQRDKTLEQSQSYKYVSQSVPGAEDLDANGTWSYDAPYGYVWQPTTVNAGWAPYRYGRWSWIDYYGWSWVSYDPWGWAPFHYGRWYMGPRGWCWWPGGIGMRHYWSPGLVGWFGGGGLSAGVGFGHVGWVPLAPHEAYRPWYGWNSYRGYGNRNYNNTNVNVVNNVNITNVYRNARVNNGVTAVSGTDFASGRFNNVVKLSENDMHRANLVNGRLPFTPDRNSQRLSDHAVAAAPRSNDSAKFYSRRTPGHAERVSFEDQRRGVEESAKRTFGSRNEAGGGTNVLAPAGSNARGAFERRSNDAGAAGATTNGGSGWRRAGEATIVDPSAASSRSGRNSVGTVTGAEKSNSTTTNTDNGWRRFGQPRNEGDVTNSRSGRSSSQNTDSNSSRRFGEPGGDSNSRRARTPDSNTNTNPNSNMDTGRTRSNDTFRRSDTNNNGGGGDSRARDSFPSAPRQEAPRHESPRMERSAPPPQSAPPARSETPRDSPRKNNFIGSNEGAPRTEGRSSGFAGAAPRGDTGSSRSTSSFGGGSARSSGSGGSSGGGGGRNSSGGGSSHGGGGGSSHGGGGGGGRH